jgi:hypothetical protein
VLVDDLQELNADCPRLRPMTIEDGSEVIETQIEKTSAPKGGDVPDGCSRRKSVRAKER